MSRKKIYFKPVIYFCAFELQRLFYLHKQYFVYQNKHFCDYDDYHTVVHIFKGKKLFYSVSGAAAVHGYP